MAQFQDLPMIPQTLDESRCLAWNAEHGYRTHSFHQYNSQFHHEQDASFFDAPEHDLVINRFMHDQYPLGESVLSASPYQYHTLHGTQWPSANAFRNVSPDRTSASNASQSTHNEVHSPLAFCAGFGSSVGLAHSMMPYSTERYIEAAFPNGLTSGGIVCPRELEYEQTTPEPTVSGLEVVNSTEESIMANTALGQSAVAPKEIAMSEYADSGIGTSIRGAESVEPMSGHEEEASDSDYSPTGRPGKRRRSSASHGSSPRGSGRRSSGSSGITKTPRPHKNHKRGKDTSQATKTYATGNEQSRPFPCPFTGYGCTSSFSSKNEWKRHVSTQHIKLGFWRCDLCGPSRDADDGTVYFNDFNRKDLFTQHLRRMHGSGGGGETKGSKKSRGPSSADECLIDDDTIHDHQVRCYHTLRVPPQRSSCLFCPHVFEGTHSWDERMEHVGRHLEKDKVNMKRMLDVGTWNEDKVLEAYLVDEGLVAMDGEGAWGIGDGRPREVVVEHEDGREEESEEE